MVLLIAGSPSQSKPVGFASSPKGRALGKTGNFVWTAKASPFGRGGTAYAVTERAREFPSPFLCFAQTAHSLHVNNAKNLCQSNVYCTNMQQKYI
ncbi:hypothetical protein C4N24_10930 [Faecalibacterium prausnitzii]|uniref:Uncharacterized protein n=1 Tax=Faecalibacterium prausnitzii TaxID=853 RepID=A0A329U303_9FIRM|nr:hypothetical protein C4N24_10930 [Faecalibacterium prausnitzii]